MTPLSLGTSDHRPLHKALSCLSTKWPRCQRQKTTTPKHETISYHDSSGYEDAVSRPLLSVLQGHAHKPSQNFCPELFLQSISMHLQCQS